MIDWRHLLVRLPYELLSAASIPLLAPICGLHPRLRGGLGARLGLLPRSVPRHAIWFHGASAGDIRALQPLADSASGAGLPVWMSCWTRSGAQMAARSLQGTVSRLPFDSSPIVARTLARAQPRMLVLECLEMWPALVLQAVRRAVPVLVVNGRISARSLSHYQAFAWLFRPMFSALRRVVALDSHNAERFEAAGVDSRRIVVGSSTKHAALPVPSSAEREPETFVLGSIHRQEARAILPQLPQLLRARPELCVVVAPRRPESAPWFRRRLRALGIRVRYRSECEPAARVVLHDRFGALEQDYANASLAFVGGSLINRGGHNVVEPAARAVPLLVGRYVGNCGTEVEALRRAGACRIVSDATQLARAAVELLSDRVSREAAGRAAREVAERLSWRSRQVLELVLADARRAHAEASADARSGRQARR